MRVLLNVDSLRPPLTGIGRYTAHFVQELPQHADVDSLTCFAGVRFVEPAGILHAALDHAAESDREPAASLVARHPAHRLRALARRLPGAYRLRTALAGRALKTKMGRMRDAVYHEPNFILRDFDGPCVATVHDLSFVHYPEFHPKERVEHIMRSLPRTLERADRILTDCAFVKNELVSTFGVAVDRVHAVPLGVDPVFSPRSDEDLVPLLARFGLSPRSYLLCVATFEPRKNLERLVRAYMRLDSGLQRRWPLVLAGAPGWHSASLDALIAKAQRHGSVRRLGYVRGVHLPSLYAGAALFAFPSIYEGFGLPLLEAMACGVPTVASATSSMPEIAADAGLLVDPMDEAALAEALTRGLEDTTWRAWSSRRGLERAALFRWSDCVARTVDVYRMAKGG